MKNTHFQDSPGYSHLGAKCPGSYMPGLSLNAPEDDVNRTWFEHVTFSLSQSTLEKENKNPNDKMKKQELCVSSKNSYSTLKAQ